MNVIRSANSKTQRLFLALFPPVELSRTLHRLASKIVRDSARRVPPENIHLTLAFFGSVEAGFRECAERAVSAIRKEPFTILLERMACWPKSGILWGGPRQTPPLLSQLVQELNAGLGACGYTPEQRPFVPHVTLARKVHCHSNPLEIEPLEWEPRELCLVQSRSQADGPRYEILRCWPLTPP